MCECRAPNSVAQNQLTQYRFACRASHSAFIRCPLLNSLLFLFVLGRASCYTMLCTLCACVLRCCCRCSGRHLVSTREFNTTMYSETLHRNAHTATSTAYESLHKCQISLLMCSLLAFNECGSVKETTIETENSDVSF